MMMSAAEKLPRHDESECGTQRRQQQPQQQQHPETRRQHKSSAVFPATKTLSSSSPSASSLLSPTMGGCASCRQVSAAPVQTSSSSPASSAAVLTHQRRQRQQLPTATTKTAATPTTATAATTTTTNCATLQRRSTSTAPSTTSLSPAPPSPSQSPLLSLLSARSKQHQPTTTTTPTSRSSLALNLARLLLFVAAATSLLIALSVVQTPVEAAETLLGNLQSCSNEGEEVQIKEIKNSKCFKCACQNGFVNCDKESCPSIDDCYLLDRDSPDTCCRKCKGCVFRGVSYASGSEWTDPEDACKTYKCIASVVTETTMKCYTQCSADQIAAPRPGECCPKCQGCKINGQLVAEGQEVVASIDDRCLVCQCAGNKLTCAKKTCPILQCPISKQKQHPNECCPRCTEHRVFMPVAGKCFFNNNVFYDSIQFTPDRCTNCTCSNGTSVCRRNTCPILECSPEYQAMDGCCPRCISSEVRSECIYNGTTYPNDETWNLGPCRSCRCLAGNIRCSEMRCPPIKCRANEELKAAAGECCPKCVETAGTCTVFGDPHFKTFDGKFFSFQGSCKYLLAADCREHSFSIRLTNDGRGTKRSSWTKTVTLKMRGVRVNLGQKLRVKINGSRVALPYAQTEPALTIERLTTVGGGGGSSGSGGGSAASLGSIMLRTELGIDVEWDGNNFLQVLVPAAYKRKLCGLCGNYNGIGRDDLTSRDGANHTDAEVWRFANSWKVGGPKACSRKAEKIAAQPTCKQRKSNAYCRPLRESRVFGHCDNRLNPINYIESCKMDVCECPTGLCHCDSFAAYAHECQRLGVRLPDWRAETNCTVDNWRRNVTAAALSANRLYGDLSFLVPAAGTATGAVGSPATVQQQQQMLLQQQQQRRQNRRRKQQQQQHPPKHNQLLQRDFITKHVPKSLLVSKSSDRTPPPLH